MPPVQAYRRHPVPHGLPGERRFVRGAGSADGPSPDPDPARQECRSPSGVADYEALIEELDGFRDVQLSERELAEGKAVSHEGVARELRELVRARGGEWEFAGPRIPAPQIREIFACIVRDRPGTAKRLLESLLARVDACGLGRNLTARLQGGGRTCTLRDAWTGSPICHLHQGCSPRTPDGPDERRALRSPRGPVRSSDRVWFSWRLWPVPWFGVRQSPSRREVPVNAIPRPDLSARPLRMTCEYTVNARPERVFAAWTKRFDTWFAQAGTLAMVPEPGRPYFFYNRDDWGRHPHYGRFLDAIENQLIEMTWMTGNGTAEGTEGAETVLRIELFPRGEATEVRLTHSGFVSEKSRDGHRENWPLALKLLNEVLS